MQKRIALLMVSILTLTLFAPAQAQPASFSYHAILVAARPSRPTTPARE